MNGTAALHVALVAAGVRPGDEVLMPALTFVATASAASYCGAVPHFVDCTPVSLGMDPDDFEIRVVDDLLVIRGEKRVERERKRDHYHVMERAYGAFERAVRLPVQVDEQSARAAYNRGVLQVTLPRLTRHKSRRIEVRAG